MLRTWIADRGLSISSFASLAGIEKTRLFRIIDGVISRISVDDAFAIEERTGGAVPAFTFRRPYKHSGFRSLDNASARCRHDASELDLYSDTPQR
jgi:hypothetical protein